MSRGWKITIVALAAVGILSTPLFWLLDGPNTGQLAGATVQAAAGIAALVWALLQHPANLTDDSSTRTGRARATGGGRAFTGVKRTGGRGRGSARAEETGDATADGPGSSASTGIDYS
ncbi:hypothetical protein OHA91_00635 [Streptomyces erythrochromogenes]|uniref:Secreted protein n=1 Tax=Streptomyces erythrochromogenes TaxID=285574 RepID=A0ABZ1Q3T2_9ACTN|nr:hypothetical protein [Streptomyces erythrochromogenes]MCX5584051.1 hypothetical protein [Streptomyces erythrochromogenes]